MVIIGAPKWLMFYFTTTSLQILVVSGGSFEWGASVKSMIFRIVA